MAVAGNEWELRATDFVAFAQGVCADTLHLMPSGAGVLDLGCGDEAIVEALLAAGYDADGCDIELAAETDRLRLIERPVHLHFDDETCDCVISTQVLEHVDDHDK